MRYLHFADICIDTHNQLLYRQGETISLAPKVYDLLVFFCQNSQRVISKDELMEQVWTGTLVTENAISRTLVKVRKALADDPKDPKFIITVPRKGYRMVADFVASDAPAKQEITPISAAKTDLNSELVHTTASNQSLEKQTPQVAQSRLNKRKLALLVVISALLVLLAINLLPSSNQVLQTKQLKPLTREQGVEIYPAVSPDLAYVAYTKEVSGKPSYINIEQLTTGTKLSVTHPRGKISKGVWQPAQTSDQAKLAFLYQHNHVCMIFSAKLSEIKNKDRWQTISECGADSSPHFTFSPDGKYLYFNDRQSTNHGYQIFRVDLANNEKEIINQPITNGLGNYSFDISPDGDYLVMANSEFAPTTRLYTLDIQASKLEQTAQLPYLMRSVIWHHDNETIIHPSPHPAYDIWQSDLAGNKLALVASNTSRVKHLSRVNNGKDFSFVSYLLNRDVHYLNDKQQSLVLDNSSVMDYLPTLAHNSNTYAFVSKRSTTAEVYLAELTQDGTGNNAKRLSHFNNPVKLYDLAFLPNDSQLMILADNQIFIADTKTFEITQLPLDNMAIAGVSWQDESHLLLSTIKNANWYLMRYNLKEQALTAMPFGYQGGLYSANDKHYYLIADDSYQIMKLADLSATPEALPLSCQPSFINRKLNLKFTDDGLVCRSAEKKNDFTQYSFTEQRSQAWQQPGSGIDFDVQNNGVIYTKMQQSVSDIMQTLSQ